MNIKKLENIFEYYAKKYRLKTDIDIDIQGQACYYTGITYPLGEKSGDYIFIGGQYIKRLKHEIKVRSGKNNLQEFYIFTLLHEISHAIDYTYNQELIKSECKNLNHGKYFDDRKYHNEQPYEIRADNFARKELTKWC